MAVVLFRQIPVGFPDIDTIGNDQTLKGAEKTAVQPLLSVTVRLIVPVPTVFPVIVVIKVLGELNVTDPVPVYVQA